MTVQPRHVRYLFLDIVSFTRDRSVEAQTDIIAAMNEVVRNVTNDLGLGHTGTFLEAVKGFRRLNVHKDMRQLAAGLRPRDQQLGIAPSVENVA